jgi:hypothetical protein
MKVLVCGGRAYSDRKRVFDELDKLRPDRIIHGGCPTGADTLADEYADHRAGIFVTVYRADWKKYGRAAGPIRNAQMATEGKPDMVLAFPGGAGTRNMVTIAKSLGIPTVTVDGTK